MDFTTFGFALAAYALLGADVAARAWKRANRVLTIGLVAVLVVHVALVWGVRFRGSLDAALAKGLAGLVVFHVAFAAIVAAAFTRETWSTRLLVGAFPVATAGAIGAAFKYDYVAWTRIPLIVICLSTVAATIAGWRRR